MLYIVFSASSDERLVCVSPEEADRTANSRTKHLGYRWTWFSILIPA